MNSDVIAFLFFSFLSLSKDYSQLLSWTRRTSNIIRNWCRFHDWLWRKQRTAFHCYAVVVFVHSIGLLVLFFCLVAISVGIVGRMRCNVFSCCICFFLISRILVYETFMKFFTEMTKNYIKARRKCLTFLIFHRVRLKPETFFRVKPYELYNFHALQQFLYRHRLSAELTQALSLDTRFRF